MIKNKYIFLGQFTQESDRIVVADPSIQINENNINYYKIIEGIKKGNWNVWIDKENPFKNKYPSLANIRPDQRSLVAIYCPSDILTHNERSEYQKKYTSKWHMFDYITTNSGQIGIYDLLYFNDNTNIDGFNVHNLQNNNEWYLMNCIITSNIYEKAGIINNGTVSAYFKQDNENKLPIYIMKNKDKIIGIRIL